MAAGGSAVTTLKDVGTLAGGDVQLAAVLAVKDHLVDVAGIRLVEHLKVRVPSVVRIGVCGVHHMGISHERVRVGHLGGGVKALLEEEFDFSVDIK